MLAAGRDGAWVWVDGMGVGMMAMDAPLPSLCARVPVLSLLPYLMLLWVSYPYALLVRPNAIGFVSPSPLYEIPIGCNVMHKVLYHYLSLLQLLHFFSFVNKKLA